MLYACSSHSLCTHSLLSRPQPIRLVHTLPLKLFLSKASNPVVNTTSPSYSAAFDAGSNSLLFRKLSLIGYRDAIIVYSVSDTGCYSLDSSETAPPPPFLSLISGCCNPLGKVLWLLFNHIHSLDHLVQTVALNSICIFHQVGDSAIGWMVALKVFQAQILGICTCYLIW